MPNTQSLSSDFKDTARAILVAVDTGETKGWDIEESLSELARLTDTAEIVVVGQLYQKLQQINPSTYIGSGKVKELKELVARRKANTLIFDDELTPRQLRTLEDTFKDVTINDRTTLILDIFAMHAHTREGKLQIELAALEYELPRLRGKWQHFEKTKLGGGLGSRFGEGETQLEVDRRMFRKRISDLKKELKKVERERAAQRAQRLESGVFRVAIVGYTNAGKSTLLNALTGSDVLAYDKLFATLDSTTRKYELESGRKTTLTDTVGFINKLPHELVAAFKSTLIEVEDAHLLLHVVDACSEHSDDLIRAVEVVLEEIDAHKIPSQLVFNKSDLLSVEERDILMRKYPRAILVSALEGTGFNELNAAIERYASMNSEVLNVTIPFDRGDLVALAHEDAKVISEEYTENGVLLTARIPTELVPRFKKFAAKE